VLVLSRKLGESICLNDNIEVVVTAIQGNRVSLGIAAPKSIGIRRGELSLAELAHVGRTVSTASGGNKYPGTAPLKPLICPTIEPAAPSAK
jgi:carbon storage regulator CsrA